MDERKLADAILRHDLAARALDKGEADKIVRLINGMIAAAKTELAGRHAKAQVNGGLDTGPGRTKFLNDEIEAYTAINQQVYTKVAQGLETNLIKRAAAEQDFAGKAARSAGIDKGFRPHDTNFLKTLVNTTPIPVDNHGSALLKSWVEGMSAGDLARFEATLREGIGRGETTDLLAKRIEAGGWAKSRQSAETVALTANAAIANAARLETFRGMRSIKYVEWSAILDSRTSAICQGLSGQIWPIDAPHPTPPAHPRCRSTLLPRTNDTDPPLHKPYREWLKGQDADTQDKVLGKKRGKAYRDGKLGDADLVRHDGSTATLDDLKRHDAEITATKPFSPINPDTTAETIELKTKREITKELNTSMAAGAKDPRYDPMPEFKGIKPEQFGKVTLPTAMSDEAASMIAAIMPEVDKITDAFDVPRLRAIRQTTGAIANMGDGTLGLNGNYFNGYAAGVGEGGATAKLVAKIATMEADMSSLRDRLTRLREQFDEAKAAGNTSRYLEIYAEQAPLAKEYRALSEKQFKLRRDLANSNNAAKETVSEWKPGDDPKTRPYNATDYFTGIDKARNVLFHEIGHQVHQMMDKTGRRRVVGRPPLEQRINIAFNKKFLKLGEGYEAKKLLSTTYATTNAEEWFAESFSLFMMGRYDLVDPDLKLLIEELLDARSK